MRGLPWASTKCALMRGDLAPHDRLRAGAVGELVDGRGEPLAGRLDVALERVRLTVLRRRVGHGVLLLAVGDRTARPGRAHVQATRRAARPIVRGSKPNGSSSRCAAISASSVSTSYVAPSADDHAVGEHHRARAQLQGVGQVVGDHQHGHVEAGQDLGQLAPGGGVEVGRRLVEDQDLRLAWRARWRPRPGGAGRS